MCEVGDIIVIMSFTHQEITVSKHSFIVINDQEGTIEGLPYDFIANTLSSTKTPEQRERKLSFKENFPIKSTDTVTMPHNSKDGYLKLDQLYYFNKEKIEYVLIGHLKEDVLRRVLKYIENSDFKFETITENL